MKKVMKFWSFLLNLTLGTFIFQLSANGQCCSNGANLLATYNPDFSAPIVTTPPGFTTDNTYSSSPGAGTYVIITSRNYGACSSTPQFDHTSGDNTGRYLWFDTRGTATVANPAVAWTPFNPGLPAGSQNLIAVTPNTTYVFSAWIRDLARNGDCVSGGAPLMGLRINGVDMAQIDLGLATNPCCPQWTYLCAEWNSGTDTTALIRIESRRGQGFTDLGIDDVYFGSTSTLNINLGNDTAICSGQSVLLQNSVAGATYLWSDGSTGNSLTVNTAGLYWSQATQNNCTGRDSILISQLFAPVVNLGADTSLCNQSSFALNPTLTGGTPASFLWQDNTTANTNTATASGLYWVQAGNQCGQSRDSIVLNFQTSPGAFSLGNDTALCNGVSLDLIPTPLPAGDFLWQNNSSSSTFSGASNGILWLRVSNTCGSFTDSIILAQIFPPVAFSLGNDTAICNGNSVLLSPFPVPSGTFLWQDNSTDNSFNVSIQGTYSLTASNQCGSTTDAIQVSIISPPAVQLRNDTSICQSDTVMITAQVTGTGNLVWSTGSSAVSIPVNSAGVYTVSISNNCGLSEDSIAISVLTNPVRPFNNLVIDTCEDVMLVLDAENAGMIFNWSTGETLQVIDVSTSGLYSVTISNNGLCAVADAVTVNTRSCTQCRAAIPTAFSPNEDGVNDVFRPVFTCPLVYYTLRIYNRWGELVFESDEQKEGWDGYFKDRPQPLGVFVYYTEYRFKESTGRESSSGNITLVR